MRFWSRYGKCFHVDIQLLQEQFEDDRIVKATVQHEVAKRAPGLHSNGFLWTEDPPVPSTLVEKIRQRTRLPSFARIRVYYARTRFHRRYASVAIDGQTFRYMRHRDPRFVSVVPELSA